MVEVGPCSKCGHARGPHRPDCSCSCHAVPSPDDLAEAERHMRQISDKGDKFARWMKLVMAEYDRLKAENADLRELLAIRDEQVEENNAIIEAAYRVAASWSPHSTEEFDGDLVAALVREVQQ